MRTYLTRKDHDHDWLLQPTSNVFPPKLNLLLLLRSPLFQIAEDLVPYEAAPQEQGHEFLVLDILRAPYQSHPQVLGLQAYVDEPGRTLLVELVLIRVKEVQPTRQRRDTRQLR